MRALIIVDVQNDFCPGGALAVSRGHEIVPILNSWIADAAAARVPVFASRDWHPADHVSFKVRGGPWPPHCIQNTHGADTGHPLGPGVDVLEDLLDQLDRGGQGCHFLDHGRPFH